ncbi:MAG: ATP-binding cassette domain-containing protein [Streptosporangiales bacterium]|nr:ATP-binding cassette domain-containing protein [Streptosporangiales bacterium]
MIRLENVTKTYPGVDEPAVADLSLDVHAGEIVVLLGPSGCGKTTTMRMINRLIEPTSGRIYIDGADVTNVDPDELRRHIGYVIQQVGLLPHLTVGANIGMVPKALGWDKKRTDDRVTELLALLGLDPPESYRRRYPKQLSGGQQQRVGVARALAADPPVMLMDEPFGALDPIIRDRLQDEFLTLQQQIHKTIVFVTHDIEEALKLGDRIAIFGTGGRIAQFDTPIKLLTEPADEFVASFIGAGSSVRLLGLQHVEELPLQAVDTVEDEQQASQHLDGKRVLLTDGGRPARWLPALADGQVATVRGGQTLYQALDAMLTAHDDLAVVTDEDGRVLGGLSMDTVLRHVPSDEAGGG